MTGSQADGIRRWVETSGRALELRTARAFGARARVEQSVRYLDEGTERETDVVGHFEWTPHTTLPNEEHPPQMSLRVYVECKTAKPGATAWVGFLDPGARWDLGGSSNDLVFAHGSYDSVKQRFDDAWLSEPPFLDYPTASHVADAWAGAEVDGAKQPKRDTSWDAVRQVMSGARAGIDLALLDFRTQMGSPRGVGIMALVVTTIPLFTCELDGSNEVAVADVDRFAVSCVGHNGVPSRVLVIHESATNTFLSDLAGVLTELRR